MKKYLSLCLIIASSLFLSACTKNNNFTSDQSQPVNQNENTSTQEFSLKELIAKNISQKCTWSVTQEGNTSTGEILIKGNKFKQIISVNSEEGNNQINAISDGQYIYTWTKSTQGNFAMKMKIDDTNPEITSDTSSTANQVDLNQKYKFDCVNANITDADFEIPKDIEFADYSEFLNQIKSTQ